MKQIEYSYDFCIFSNVDQSKIPLLGLVLFCSLGASHDDSSGNGGNCSADDNYIMAPQHQMDPDKVKNLYQFSSCSTNKIVQHIRQVEDMR